MGDRVLRTNIIQIQQLISRSIIVLIIVQWVGEQDNISLLDIDIIVHSLELQSYIRRCGRELDILRHMLPGLIDGLAIVSTKFIYDEKKVSRRSNRKCSVVDMILFLLVLWRLRG